MQLLLKSFEDYLRSRDASPSTIRGYLSDLQKFQAWYEDAMGSALEFEAVGPLDIAEFKRYLQTQKKKPGTVNRALRSLQSFFKWAVKENLIRQNPAAGIKPVAEVKNAPKALDKKEQQALMRAVSRAEKDRDIAMVTLLVHTGLRVSEACSLTVDDVVIGERSGHLVVRAGKGNKYREVPLNITARKALKNWLDTREKTSEYLFPGQNGRHLAPRSVEYLLARYAYDARLENVSPHVLRHTFCKALVDAGESLDRVAAIAGHANINTTIKYTQPTNKDLQASVDKLSWE